MKKNKKYWKKEAKGWKEVAHIESEEANNWAAKAIDLQEQVDQLQNELDKYKNPATTTSGSWNVGPSPIIKTGYGTGKISGTNTNYQVWSKGKNSCPCGCKRD